VPKSGNAKFSTVILQTPTAIASSVLIKSEPANISIAVIKTLKTHCLLLIVYRPLIVLVISYYKLKQNDLSIIIRIIFYVIEFAGRLLRELRSKAASRAQSSDLVRAGGP
jgi:hypothetical protein